MSGTVRILINGYYEQLCELILRNDEFFAEHISEALAAEFDRVNIPNITPEKMAAYDEACRAFVTERIEMYNPIGHQYTFDRGDTRDAFQLELELNWYDGRQEYLELLESARDMLRIETDPSEEQLKQWTEQLIARHGAWPNRSIIRDYEAAPPNKLPDYIVAILIEKLIRTENSDGNR